MAAKKTLKAHAAVPAKKTISLEALFTIFAEAFGGSVSFQKTPSFEVPEVGTEYYYIRSSPVNLSCYIQSCIWNNSRSDYHRLSHINVFTDIQYAVCVSNIINRMLSGVVSL